MKTGNYQGVHRGGGEWNEGMAKVKKPLNKSSVERPVGK